MKKMSIFLALCMLLVLCTSGLAYADGSIVEVPDVKIVIDGEEVSYEDVTISVNGSIMLPLRALLTDLGIENDDSHIIWNGTEKSVTIVKDSIRVKLTQGDTTAYVNDMPITLDAAPVGYNKNQRTYIPVRFAAQSLGKKVDWDNEGKCVIISSGTSDETEGKQDESKGVEDTVKEVTVSTAEEFVNEIDSNKKIILKPGIYDLSSISHIDSPDGTITWKEVYDGKELNIKNISNLTIEGAADGKTEIRTSPRYAYIMHFNSVSNINIKNIVAGHDPQDYECDAGVLMFENSQNIAINDSELYGCGSVGIKTYAVKGLTCSGTLIDRCSLRAIDISMSEDIKFSDCKIVDHGAYSNIVYIVGSKSIIFEECEFADNHNFTWGFFEANDSQDILIDRCSIYNNTNRTIEQGVKGEAVCFFNVTPGSLTLKDSTLMNNKSDYLMNEKDSVIFDNCTMENNSWKLSRDMVFLK